MLSLQACCGAALPCSCSTPRSAARSISSVAGPWWPSWRVFCSGPKFARAVLATGLEVPGLVQGYLALVTLVQPDQVPAVIKADPADDRVLACALAARADAIVSGDRHLHGLGGAYEGIAITRPAQAVQMLAT